MQQAIYRKYCQTLNINIKKQKPPKEKVLYGRSSKPDRRLTYEEAVKLVEQEMRMEQEELKKFSRKITEKSSKSRSRKSSKSTEKSSIVKDSLKASKILEHSLVDTKESHDDTKDCSEVIDDEEDEYYDDFESDSEIKTEI